MKVMLSVLAWESGMPPIGAQARAMTVGGLTPAQAIDNATEWITRAIRAEVERVAGGAVPEPEPSEPDEEDEEVVHLGLGL